MCDLEAVLSWGAVYCAVQARIKILCGWNPRESRKPLCVAIQVKAIEQFFRVIPFIELYKVIFTFKSVDEPWWEFKWKLLSRAFMWYLFFMLYKVGDFYF